MTTPQKGYKYKPEYCEQVRKHMSKGYSFATFGCDIGVYKQTLYNWCIAYPEFKEAKEIGTEASRKMLEGLLLRIATTGKGDVRGAIYLLKNKFPNEWRNKHKLEEPKEEYVAILSLDEQLAKVEAIYAYLLQLKAERGEATPSIS